MSNFSMDKQNRTSNIALWIAAGSLCINCLYIISIILLAQYKFRSVLPKLLDSPGNPSAESLSLSQLTLFSVDHIKGSIESSDDLAWSEKLLPGGSGILAVRHNDSMNENWGISMFHGLHCLQMLRFMVEDAMSGKEFEDPSHAGHCIDYLSKSLVCSGDLTLEPPDLQFSPEGYLKNPGVVNGMDVHHQCRDTTLAWKLVEESKENPIDPWEHRVGDTVDSVFGRKELSAQPPKQL